MQSFQFRNDVTPPGDATIDVGVRPIALATFLNLDLEYQVNKVNAPARQELEFLTELSAAQILLAECPRSRGSRADFSGCCKKTPLCWPRGPD
ncbi:hypothetical protein [Bradyrhizobium sp. RT6a]|uniref:hypothetical protein n=1 Tax=unclassified Bradyrhizobium TaxID=2631580 RepID=UPI00339136C7